MRSYFDLPQEIIFDILSRVPAKSVGLCRCVSKPWKALLSQPKFIKTHLQVSKINSLESLVFFVKVEPGSEIYSTTLNNANHLIDNITLSLTKLIFPGYNPCSKYRIYGSCDGLLLFLLLNNQDNLFVLNPVTRKIRQLPRPPLALDRDASSCIYGFGYDSVSNDYKVLVISSWFSWTGLFIPEETYFYVYSFKTGSWKRLERFPYDIFGPCRAPGSFVGGCLHWIARRTTDDKLAIVAFNLADEKFREVPPPCLISGELIVCDQVSVLGGCLCMFYARVTDEVWVMKEYGVSESWTKFTVDPSCMFECFLRGHEEVMVLEEYPYYRFMWNPKHGTLKDVVLNGLHNHPNMNHVHVEASYVESLISPHDSNELE